VAQEERTLDSEKIDALPGIRPLVGGYSNGFQPAASNSAISGSPVAHCRGAGAVNFWSPNQRVGERAALSILPPLPRRATDKTPDGMLPLQRVDHREQGENQRDGAWRAFGWCKPYPARRNLARRARNCEPDAAAPSAIVSGFAQLNSEFNSVTHDFVS
jgi:hypothetical protein